MPNIDDDAYDFRDGYSTVTSFLLLERPGLRGYHTLPCPSLDDLDADHSHTGGSSYLLSRRRKKAVKP